MIAICALMVALAGLAYVGLFEPRVAPPEGPVIEPPPFAPGPPVMGAWVCRRADQTPPGPREVLVVLAPYEPPEDGPTLYDVPVYQDASDGP